MSESKKKEIKLDKGETRFITNTNYNNSRIPPYNELTKVKAKPPKKVLVSKNISRGTVANSMLQSRIRSHSETTCKAKKTSQSRSKNIKVKETDGNKSVNVSQVYSCPNYEKKPLACSLDAYNEIPPQNEPRETDIKNGVSELSGHKSPAPTRNASRMSETKTIVSRPIISNPVKHFNRIDSNSALSSKFNTESNMSFRHNKSIQTCAKWNALKELNINIRNPSTISCTCDDCLSHLPIASDENNLQGHVINTLNVSDIRNFRDKYFFECHSVDSRLKNNESANSVKHKCSYDYYLNKRLFPVPVCSDHKNIPRCVECLLPPSHNRCPMSQKSSDEQSENVLSSDTRSDDKEEKADKEILSTVNGRIKTKVSLSNFSKKLADAIIKIPVNNKMVITERVDSKSLKQKKTDRGVLKLTSDPIRSMLFTPQDSLALRYQKGFREIKATRGVKQFTHCFDVK